MQGVKGFKVSLTTSETERNYRFVFIGQLRTAKNCCRYI
jgi:hypothetical protein